MRRTISAVTAFGGAIGISTLALKLVPLPFLWIGLTWAVTGFAIAVRAPSLVQRPLVTTGSVSFAFALGEAVFALTDTSPPQLHHDMVPFPNKPDPLLGWKLAPSQVSHVTAKIDRGELIYAPRERCPS